MTAFWLAAAALLIVALALLLPPLLRERRVASLPAPIAAAGAAPGSPANLSVLREQLAQLDAELADGAIGVEQHCTGRREIERRVLDEESAVERPAAAGAGRATGTAFAVLLLLPVVAAGLYAAIGTPGAIDARSARTAPADAVSMQDVEAMVARLAARMEARPGDPQGWALLARTYVAMQRFPEASGAYGKALALAPDDAQLLADHADVLAMLQNSTVSGAPEQLVIKALKIAPDNLKALALAGSAAFERRDFVTAVAHWTKARALAPAGSEFAAGLDRSIDEARGSAGRPGEGAAAMATAPFGEGATAALAGGTSPARAARRSDSDAGTSTGGLPAGSTAAAGGGGGTSIASLAAATAVSGRVSLSPSLAARALPGDTVFVFARAVDGPRMPLAILRRSVADLPFSFTLDDAMAMSPAMKLSNFAQVVVGARVSKSGNAMPQPGDLVGQTGPVASSRRDLALLIDAVQP